MYISNITAREFKPDELELGLKIRNEIFAPMTADDWEKEENKTAAIAFEDNRAVGFLPLYLRELKLNKDANVVAAFENAVGTHKDYRGRGVGTAMVNAMCSFLKGKADALYVYRSDERSQGYGFYKKTGHADLLHLRRFNYENNEADIDGNVVITGSIEEIYKNQEYLMDIFEETYESFGGFPARYDGYWKKALNSSIYVCLPTEFHFFKHMKNGHMDAYLIAGKSIDNCGRHTGDRLQVLEMASRTHCEDAMKALLNSACAFAGRIGLKGISILTSDYNPFLFLFESLNFEQLPRGNHMLALSFDSRSFFGKVWKEKFDLKGVELKVWTPKQDFVMLESNNDDKMSVTLEMKEDTLTQWLMGRIDFKSRIREGNITVINGNRQIIEEIAGFIPLCKWQYHHLDYI